MPYMGRSVLHYNKSKNLSGEAYIQSYTNSPGIIKTSQKIERLIKTRALLYICIFGFLNVIHSETMDQR